MKELNSAHQTSFNQAIPKIETFLRTQQRPKQMRTFKRIL